MYVILIYWVYYIIPKILVLKLIQMIVSDEVYIEPTV
jgi:hypothetical protein